MPYSSRLVLVFLLTIPVAALGLSAQPPEPQVAATIETTLSTAPGQIRQFAFDGDPNTFFASKKNAAGTDHFTLVFDKPVAIKSIGVITGKPPSLPSRPGEGKFVWGLDAGTLQISATGKKFEPAAKFTEGSVRLMLDRGLVKSIRIQPSEDLKHPLAIREITIVSDPPVAVFKYPVEFLVDVTDAPEMKDWARKAAQVCERQYRMICEELKSDGYKPPHLVRMTLRNDFQGVAATSGSRIVGSVKYFKAHPNDVGAMVHETVHVVQGYRGGGNPGWLVEGIADYLRFFKYEPGKMPKLDPSQVHYDGSYQVSAAFLDYLTNKYDAQIVCKLNQIMRQGKYKDEVFKEVTNKTLPELDQEWRASLRKGQ